jgi:16S rRNA A1518/A1519 N6-dimethyltransferase RsmA/KsgA/DIM1 with predicted DNA glycosylase/AP lyase activity
MAAALDQPDADVPAGSGRADRRHARSDAFGRLAVLSQWRAKAKIAVKVHRSAFTRRPR